MLKRFNDEARRVLLSVAFTIIFTAPLKITSELRLTIYLSCFVGGVASLVVKAIEERENESAKNLVGVRVVQQVAAKPVFRSAVVRPAIQPTAIPLEDPWAEDEKVEVEVETPELTMFNWMDGD